MNNELYMYIYIVYSIQSKILTTKLIICLFRDWNFIFYNTRVFFIYKIVNRFKRSSCIHSIGSFVGILFPTNKHSNNNNVTYNHISIGIKYTFKM